MDQSPDDWESENPDPKPEEPKDPLTWDVTDWDGEVIECMHGGFFVDKMEALLNSVPNLDTLNGLWDTNLVNVHRLKRGADQQKEWAVVLETAYDNRLSVLEAKERFASSPAPRQGCYGASSG